MGDRKTVYSTEHGSLERPSRERGGKRRRTKRRSPEPAGRGVRVRRESKGRGGKTVTVVTGLPLAGPELKALLKRLKGKLGTGGTCKEGRLEFQGDRRERLLELLAAEGHAAKPAGG